ncbi:2-oxo acid dehydrogenase subunit E2 [Pseudodesulfovibrio sediminis]|uniref:Dihydrolipoamide acetyltransferase component of pyruvate dehydrogenase complex n=1 Tax=Pseudodesulfovibrio sediminis TaxID=2810563 RepID=A0ABM7P309_9BACT|nr:2-oxo acid dehydrogenase subunit E2 [Pseudodesulfovibrio sediminis]BCS87169.1 dihydrolipoamide acetyltransferase component of pyruvate dehydrogenase complex [Pseudodesulfovibrio sediminis]
MAEQVIMPKWGLTMKEGKVVRWLKSEGDQVEAGEELFEVETDKITNSVEAPASGILFQIIVPEGEVAPVQAVLATIAAPGETPEKAAAGAAPEAEASAPAAEAPSSTTPTPAVEDGEFVPAMPAARKLAKELGVALSTIVGTGPNGSITRKDVQETADAACNVNASPKAIEFARKKGIDLNDVTGTGDGGRITKADILRAMNPAAEQPAQAAQAAAKDTIVPMDGVRKLIADNMHASLNSAAQLSVFVELDVTELVALRTSFLERNKRNQDYRLSYNDLVSYAVCRALKRHPIMNSTLQDDGIHMHEHVNLGIAVALPNGLIVPNVKMADTFTLEELKVEVRDVASRARKGGLSMDEIAGGTFTISNVSMLGVDGFTPILNPPETGILGVGRIVEKPAVKDGEICIRQMMTLSLTFNHMTTDGAPAMSFLRELGDMLENPGLMIA